MSTGQVGQAVRPQAAAGTGRGVDPAAGGVNDHPGREPGVVQGRRVGVEQRAAVPWGVGRGHDEGVGDVCLPPARRGIGEVDQVARAARAGEDDVFEVDVAVAPHAGCSLRRVGDDGEGGTDPVQQVGWAAAGQGGDRVEERAAGHRLLDRCSVQASEKATEVFEGLGMWDVTGAHGGTQGVSAEVRGDERGGPLAGDGAAAEHLRDRHSDTSRTDGGGLGQRVAASSVVVQLHDHAAAVAEAGSEHGRPGGRRQAPRGPGGCSEQGAARAGDHRGRRVHRSPAARDVPRPARGRAAGPASGQCGTPARRPYRDSPPAKVSPGRRSG